jgi:hypothetical protein
VHLVGDLENVAVRDQALDHIVVEERRARVSTQHEGELPCEVVTVVQARVEPFAAEGAREMGGVADQETPAVRQARDDPPVHPERREPGDVGGSIFLAEACLDPGDDVFGGYGLHLLFQVLERDPAPARERREEQQAMRTADDAGLVARKGCRHRDVGDQEMPSIGRALERLTHRMARDAVRPARPDDHARADRLRPAVRMEELDEELVCLRLQLGRSDPALDEPAERREMGLEDPLGLVLGEAALELVAAVDACVAHGAELGHAGAVQTGTPDVLGRVEERRQRADGLQDLEGAGLDRRRARFAVRPHVSLDEPRRNTMAGELGGGEQAGRARADDQDVVGHHSISLGRQTVRGFRAR